MSNIYDLSTGDSDFATVHSIIMYHRQVQPPDPENHDTHTHRHALWSPTYLPLVGSLLFKTWGRNPCAPCFACIEIMDLLVPQYPHQVSMEVSSSSWGYPQSSSKGIFMDFPWIPSRCSMSWPSTPEAYPAVARKPGNYSLSHDGSSRMVDWC